MKILIVNTFDIQGGAARAAYRLNQSLLGQDIDSQMLVWYEKNNDVTVVTETPKVKKFFNRFLPIMDSIPVMSYRKKTKTLFSPSWLPSRDVVDKINKIKTFYKKSQFLGKL